jgi:hypothetical protein
MIVQKTQSLRLAVPEWFLRSDFKKWLEDWTAPSAYPGRRSLATWHNHLWLDLTTTSDVFVLYDYGDLSDGEDLPGDILEAIVKACEEHGLEYGLVWLAPCDNVDTARMRETSRAAERIG